MAKRKIVGRQSIAGRTAAEVYAMEAELRQARIAEVVMKIIIVFLLCVILALEITLFTKPKVIQAPQQPLKVTFDVN